MKCMVVRANNSAAFPNVRRTLFVALVVTMPYGCEYFNYNGGSPNNHDYELLWQKIEPILNTSPLYVYADFHHTASTNNINIICQNRYMTSATMPNLAPLLDEDLCQGKQESWYFKIIEFAYANKYGLVFHVAEDGMDVFKRACAIARCFGIHCTAELLYKKKDSIQPGLANDDSYATIFSEVRKNELIINSIASTSLIDICKRCINTIVVRIPIRVLEDGQAKEFGGRDSFLLYCVNDAVYLLTGSLPVAARINMPSMPPNTVKRLTDEEVMSLVKWSRENKYNVYVTIRLIGMAAVRSAKLVSDVVNEGIDVVLEL